jgi:CubicO group peptidase (beta-lactamase class C family)
MPALPDVAPVPQGVVITPRMLLQHTSGLVNYMNATGYDPTAPMTPAKAVSLSLGTPLLAEPGVRAHYSNSNFHWLGLLLEHASGRPYATLVDGLAAGFGLASAAVSAPARPGWIGFASGGMEATLDDVATWGAHLFTPGAVLPPADLDAYRAVGPLGVGLGIWPICPCTTDATGAVEYTAIGQIVADGGLLHFPDGDVVVAVRLANVPGDIGTLTASVAGAIRAALADDGPVRVQ